MIYFSKPGSENTEDTLKLAIQGAVERNIKHLIVASTFGDTAQRALQMIPQDKDLKLIVVTHNTGFAQPGEQQFRPEVREQVEKAGGKVYTGTMVLRSLGRAIRNKSGYSQEELVNATLRMFGQGMKVCVEIAAMACDAGFVPPTDVVAVAGTDRGADTAVVLKADSSNNFFDIKIREILAKPREF